MTYAYNFPGEEERLDLVNIQRSAGEVANAAYREKYGNDKQDDPEWKIGGERHEFWLKAFEDRWKSLIMNPYQN